MSSTTANLLHKSWKAEQRGRGRRDGRDLPGKGPKGLILKAVRTNGHESMEIHNFMFISEVSFWLRCGIRRARSEEDDGDVAV